MSRRVAVVGAGWAGLSAAVRLTQAGFGVDLLESAAQAGGRAREARLDFGRGAVVLDAGQHLLVGAYRECLELATLVAGESTPLERFPLALCDTSGLRIETASLPAPLHLLSALLFARGMNAAQRLAAAGLVSSLRAQGWRVPAGETVDALLRRHRQPATLVDRLWSPLCIAALNTASDVACAAAYACVLRDSLGASRDASDFVLPRTTLADALAHPAWRWLRARGARLFPSTTLRALMRDGEGWLLHTSTGPLRCAQAVLATPAWVSARLLAPLDARAQALGRFDYDAIATVYLAWPDSTTLPMPRWIMLRESPRRRHYGQWLFDRGSVGAYRIAAAVVSARGRLSGDAPEAIARGIAEQVASQLELPVPEAHRTVTEKRATFRCTPDRPRIAFDAFTDALPGLWLAGDYVDPEYPATLEAAVRSGRNVARAIATAAAGQPQAASIA